MSDIDAMKMYLKSLGEESYAILRSILSPLQRNILNIVNTSKDMATVIRRVGNKLSVSSFFNEINSPKIQSLLSNIEQAIAYATTNISSGAMLVGEQLSSIMTMVKQNFLDMLGNFGNNFNRNIRNAVQMALDTGQTPKQLSQTLQKRFKLNEHHAKTLANTEMARAGNLARHAQGIENGAKYFVVDPRAGACKYCYAKYEGEIFDVTETLQLPPLHPNCKCIPVYFKKLDDAGDYAGRIMDRNTGDRASLIDKGYNIPQDGTQPLRPTQYRVGLFDGPNQYFKNYNDTLKYVKQNTGKVKYVLSENVTFGKTTRTLPGIDMVDRAGVMTIPRTEFYAAQKRIYKKIRNPIMNVKFEMQNLTKKQWIKNIKNDKIKPFNKPVKIKNGKVFDLHIHTEASPDSKMKVKDAIKAAKDAGLDGIAITDHNSMASIKEAMKYNTKKFTVIPGCEITTTKGHMIGLGIQKPIRPGLSPRATAEAIRRQGGVVISPHSMSRYRDGIYAAGARNMRVDVIEAVNSRYAFGYSNMRARSIAEDLKLGMVGSSDSHKAFTIGTSVTKVDVSNGVLTGIKTGRTNAYSSQVSTYNAIKQKLMPWKNYPDLAKYRGSLDAIKKGGILGKLFGIKQPKINKSETINKWVKWSKDKTVTIKVIQPDYFDDRATMWRGNYDPKTKVITVNGSQSETEQLKTIHHELSHYYNNDKVTDTDIWKRENRAASAEKHWRLSPDEVDKKHFTVKASKPYRILGSFTMTDYTEDEWKQSCILKLKYSEEPNIDYMDDDISLYQLPVIDSDGYFDYDKALEYSDMLMTNDLPWEVEDEQRYNALSYLEYLLEQLNGE